MMMMIVMTIVMMMMMMMMMIVIKIVMMIVMMHSILLLLGDMYSMVDACMNFCMHITQSKHTITTPINIRYGRCKTSGYRRCN